MGLASFKLGTGEGGGGGCSKRGKEIHTLSNRYLKALGKCIKNNNNPTGKEEREWEVKTQSDGGRWGEMGEEKNTHNKSLGRILPRRHPLTKRGLA